ncbi:MAG: hypothetical protein M3N22_01255 [Acidobacteriota bacterium]|nr:hypothetical protein [Acidobacteriota bacterium]
MDIGKKHKSNLHTDDQDKGNTEKNKVTGVRTVNPEKDHNPEENKQGHNEAEANRDDKNASGTRDSGKRGKANSHTSGA